ncbi:phosphoribosyltransferase [Cellulomonas taurus]|uniref:phosphoribosyltransferase n=1 Tax=Cellulomonas taurus TaxID=2729175 RepID=UPI00145DBEDF|nr:phosphoribosyltransferase [Cellulomonas taurus]
MTFAEAAAGQELPEDREILTWDDFGEAARQLAREVVASGFEPDVVIAVARGGLLPAGALSYALGLKACDALNVEFYTGVDARLTEPQVLPPFLDTDALVGRRVLVVDDVADTGETLALVQKIVAKHCEEARTVVLYSKPHSIVSPDFVWRRTAKWITFPWSALPPVTA